MRDLVYDAAGEAIGDALVVLKMVRRKGGKRRPGAERASGLTGAPLEAAIDRWASKYPDHIH